MFIRVVPIILSILVFQHDSSFLAGVRFHDAGYIIHYIYGLRHIRIVVASIVMSWKCRKSGSRVHVHWDTGLGGYQRHAT